MMLVRLRQFFASPVFNDDKDKMRLATLLHMTLLAALAGAAVYIAVLPLVAPNQLLLWMLTGSIFPIVWGLMLLLRRGQVQLTSWLLSAALWCLMTLVAVNGGGVHSVGFNGYIIPILIAGLLLGGRAALILAGLSIAAGLGVTYAELNNLLPPLSISSTPISVWLTQTLFFLVMALMLYFATRSRAEALERTTRNERTLPAGNRALQATQGSLRNQTIELSKVNKQLQDEVAERRRVVKALREAYQILSFHIENSPLAVIEWDSEFRVQNWSKRAEEIFGWKLEEIVGKHPTEWSFIHPSDVHKVEAVITELLDSSRSRSVNRNRNYTKSGTIVCCEWYESALFDVTGRLVSVWSLVQDVTERRQFEQKLKNSEKHFRSLIENSFDGIILYNADGIMKYVSPSVKNILGYSSEELIGRGGYEFVAPDNLKIAEHNWQKLIASPRTNFRLQQKIKHKKGHYIWVEARLTNLLNDPAVQAVVSNYQDITERKQAEEALRASEERFRRVISSLSDHIYMTEVSEETKKINRYLSPNVTELTGYPLEKFMADWGFWPSTVIHPDDRKIAAAQAGQLVKGQSSEIEYRLVRADGGIIWVRDSARVEERDPSKIVYGVVSDITGRKNLEAQLLQSQKMEAVGQLAGGVAHDFNNILVVINGYSELLLQRYLDDNSPLRHHIEEIRKAGERAASLTRQLLAFSRKQVLEPKVLNLNQVVHNTEQMLRRLIGENIDLLTRLEPNLKEIETDVGQIEQVIMNLVVNARDAMPKGGRLTIETANVNLDETNVWQHSHLRPGAYVMLAVTDTGFGMDQETLSRIFEPFFTTKEKDRGTGLGLSMVYGIVKQSGGDILVCSKPNQGTTFKVYLPQVELATEAAEAEAGPGELTQGLETILLVEDEPTVRELVRALLEKDGYTVLEASYGAEALHISEQFDGLIHLLVTDVVMPKGMNGRELAERLAPLRPDMKILFMSGYTDDTIIRHKVLDSDAGFLQKPFTPKALARKVRQVLEEKRLADK